MLNRLTDTLDFQAQSLTLRSQRQRLIASNIANADTPGYKARDFDFRSALASAVAPAATVGKPATAPASPPEMLYRQVIQPSVDGNTVDMDAERAQFADNAIHVEANLTILNSQLKAMLAAIQG